jgi:hypothetical protein
VGPTDASFRFFSPTGFWNSPVPTGAALAPRSPQIVEALATEVRQELATEIGPWISTASYSVPIYTVPADQPTVRVRLVGHPEAAALRAAWSSVPIPPSATPAIGSDGHLVVWQPHSDRLWEFWRLTRTPAGWQAGWGGAMRNTSTLSGAYERNAWPGASPDWGASASSLSIAGGLITFGDLEQGSIDHALAISLPEIRQGVFAAPAKRSDGASANPLSLPEGAHLQLDPGLDLSTLKMPPLTRMIARAAQRFGIYVRDGAADVTFYGQAPHSPAANPYQGADGYFGGQLPSQLLAAFPWQQLRVLNMPLHSVAPSSNYAAAAKKAGL